MKCLITGVNGFLGKAMYRTILNDQNYEQVIGTTHFDIMGSTYENRPEGKRGLIVECQLESPGWVTRFLGQYKPDVIFHLSGFGSQNKSAKDIFNSHVLSTLNILDVVQHQENRPAFIHMSSVVIDGHPLPLYGAAKASAEVIVKSYTSLDKIEGVSVRSCAITGAGANHGLLPDIFKRLFDNNSQELELWGAAPGTRKPFVNVNTLCTFLAKLPYRRDWFRYSPIIFSPVDTLTVQEVAMIAMGLSNRPRPINWLEHKVWAGDQKVVNPMSNLRHIDYKLGSSREEVEKSMKEILRKDYGWKNSES